ncbi:TPA: hypothetical protein QCI06_004644, partial [Enterobacter roggenkampii]|nr:hypothetical protein [Enterobacter roggenkampii]
DKVAACFRKTCQQFITVGVHFRTTDRCTESGAVLRLKLVNRVFQLLLRILVSVLRLFTRCQIFSNITQRVILNNNAFLCIPAGTTQFSLSSQ